MKYKISLLIPLCVWSINAIAQKTQTPNAGQVLYTTNCTPCHGTDGTLGNYGAANLRQSMLNDVKLLKKISNGGWVMPAWKKKLSPAQIEQVLTYVKTLRN